MSTVKTNNVQIGQSVTATNNFTLYQPSSPDGTVRLGNGNSGSVTDLVTLTSAGNLGIGTSSPVSQLNLNLSTGGDLRLTRTTVGGGSSTLGSISFGNQSASSLSSILATEGGSTTSSILAFYTATGGSSSERMRLDSSGNLGIGTSSPGSKLQVNGTSTLLGSGGASVQWGDTSSLGALSFDGSGNPLIRANTGLPLVFQTNGANERARIDSNGNQFATQTAPAAVNVTATLTVANLQTRIITSTTAAAVTGTLPTGTLMDGWYAANTNMAVDWSVINTGTNQFTINAGTGHTLVGYPYVNTSTSALFRSQRTAANTWITYRIG